MKSISYVLMTPARNEEQHIADLLQAVVAQTLLPQKWIIISDGSTDRTDDIIQDYARQHSFIQYLRTEPDSSRNFASKVYALQKAWVLLEPLNYDFIGNLDADVMPEPNYFENLLAYFHRNPQLGIGGGVIVEDHDGNWLPQYNASSLNVAGAVQLFRRSCFEQIGGYQPLPCGGVDAFADLLARMHGWQVRSFTDLTVKHHRITGTEASSLLAARMGEGRLEYAFGYHPLFEMAKLLARIAEKPRVIGGLARLWGFMRAWWGAEQIVISSDAVAWLRREQLSRLFPFISAPEPKKPVSHSSAPEAS
ncbi:glycosyltransferase [Candidatus Venteria ishoeyi]|uniref:Poly-beta-1,6-N-acetyl-D-glucosamine synthase n=1 Tax=Candidatus Venteria ishoeyi TaxID=1899563 RepID=A0A1H6F818_9GAMM|nr:glycosyltransferase family 2 protein [Candidatus Venteria ishoeyi]SEH06272.1 Poly-beta-1%2C6-N-acetyl-D-glucosamine synthase [Candidatus Venteria ishoeyi]